MTLNIKWNRKAIEQLDEAIKYIEVDSVANAKKVKKKILFKIDDLLRHPERYSPDKYKTENDGSFRAFELHRYRISYRYKHPEIRIVRIRHTKMNPLEF
jgi:plasmid stabilization system protein ParE